MEMEECSPTVTLAWKFDLIETLSVAMDTSKPTLKCEFSHLIVIDFESTCWDNHRGDPEIIEFPAVLINLADGSVVDEFHEYVGPTENPILSAFCKNFTGITQEQVDDSAPLKVCLVRFSKWFTTVTQKHGIHSVAFVTWTDWDLNICLRKECSRKSIARSAIFNRWIDLRLVFKEHIQHAARGLKSAVAEMGLVFEGREHSGIWDARNTARLAWKLHTSGAYLRITKDIGSKFC